MASSVSIARRNSHQGENLLSAGGVRSPQSHADLMQLLPDHKWVGFPKVSRSQMESAEAFIPPTLSSDKLEVTLAKQREDLFAQSCILIQHLIRENN